MSKTEKDLYELGEIPPLGHVPEKMYAQVIRPERFGEPTKAFEVEVVSTPKDLRPDEVLVYVMAAGVNYNNVWAGLGTPIDVTKNRPKDPWFPDPSGFHIGGSDASGVVWAVGSEVEDLKVGDTVVMHCGQWRREDPRVSGGGDPMYSASFRIWGVRDELGQLRPVHQGAGASVPSQTRGAELGGGASYMLVGATAYRMLTGWWPNVVRPGDLVLVWGGAGGLGSMAIQIVRELGGNVGGGRLVRRQIRVLREARREGLHQSQGLRPLGALARLEGSAGTGHLVQGGASLWQGDLGNRWGA